MFKIARLLTLLFLVSLLLVASGGQSSSTVEAGVANTIIVNGTTCTLSDAIRAANTDTAVGGCPAGDGADSLILNADVTLSAADTTHSTALAGTYAGLPDINSEITIVNGTHDTIRRSDSLSCDDEDADAFRLFNATGSALLTLDGVVVENGCAAPAGDAYGGGIYLASGSDLHLENGATLANHTARGSSAGSGDGHGGAVYGELNTNIVVTNGSLSGNTVLGGSNGAGGTASGGAIYAVGYTTLIDASLTDNLARGGDGTTGIGGYAFGGVVYAESILSVIRSTFSGNMARGGDAADLNGGFAQGGVLCPRGTVTKIEDSVFTDNLARGGDSTGNWGGFGYGGAIDTGSVSHGPITGTIFRNNIARGGDSNSAIHFAGRASGGALYGVVGGSMQEISNTFFEDNQAVAGVGNNGADGRSAEGGAIFYGGSITLLTGVTFANNTAQSSDSAGDNSRARGGALFNDGLIGTLTNSTFSGNLARGGSSTGSGDGGDAQGGAIANVGTINAFAHNTLTDNQAIAGSGPTSDGLASGGSVFSSDAWNINNSLLSGGSVTPGGGSASANDCHFITTDVTSGGYNLVEAPGPCSFGATGDVVGVLVEREPLADNGCSVALPDGSCVPTVAPSPYSLAWERGSCASSGLSVDQRGFSRPVDVPTIASGTDSCDVGAVEAQTTPSAPDIVVDGATCELRDAIIAANTGLLVGGCQGSTAPDTIILNTDVILSAAEDRYSSLLGNNFAGLPDILSEMTIQAGTHRTIARDSGLGCATDPEPTAFRLLGILPSGDLTLDGITVRNGCTNGFGGGIYSDGGTLTLSNGSLLTGNHIYGSGPSQVRGGGIYSDNGLVEISNSTLAGNTLTSTGGTDSGWGAGLFTNASATISSSTFANNVTTGNGGGLAAGATGTTISGTTFEHNHADDSGAALYTHADIDEITDNLFSGNTSGANGGAVYVKANVNTFSSNLFTANTAGVSGGGMYNIGTIIIYENNLLAGNTAGNAGGGLFNASSISALRSTTFSQNQVAGSAGSFAWGGAIYNASAGNITLQNVTISGNRIQGGDDSSGGGGDASGGGIFNNGTLVLAQVTLVDNHAYAGAGSTTDGTAAGGGIYTLTTAFANNSLLADNTIIPAGGTATPNDCDFMSGGVGSVGYNLVKTPGACTFASVGDQSGVEPEVAPLMDNGCGTALPDGSCVPTHALLASSPAIDAGSCVVSTASDDQRGQSRPFDVTALANVADGCDSGAFELQQQVPANPPTVLDVQTTCQSVTVDYLARDSGDTAAMVVRVYREVPGSTDILVAQMSMASTEAGERYSESLAFGRVYPAGTALYLEIPTSGGTLTTPAQPCSTP